MGLEVAFGEIGAGKLLIIDCFLVAAGAVLRPSSTGITLNPPYPGELEVGDWPRLTYLRLL